MYAVNYLKIYIFIKIVLKTARSEPHLNNKITCYSTGDKNKKIYKIFIWR